MVCCTKRESVRYGKDTDGTALYNVKVVIDGTGGTITDDRGYFPLKEFPGSYTVTAKLFEYEDLS